MAHPLPYSIPYITASATQYMMPTHTHHPHVAGNVHMISPAQIKAEQPQRKRPKYTRSKTGCLTCRAKKIKCDEGKPKCHRCDHSHRECTWPDPAPAKKKTSARKNSSPQDDASVAESVSRSSGSPVSRDATPNTRDADGNINPSSLADPTRRYSGSQGYAYVESGTPINRRQTSDGYNSMVDPTPSVPMSSGTSLTPPYPYDFRQSPSGSISSRSNSRPSTANSLPPSHYNSSAGHSVIDSRDYPRWETMPTHRAETTYTYYPTA